MPAGMPPGGMPADINCVGRGCTVDTGGAGQELPLLLPLVLQMPRPWKVLLRVVLLQAVLLLLFTAWLLDEWWIRSGWWKCCCRQAPTSGMPVLTWLSDRSVR